MREELVTIDELQSMLRDKEVHDIGSVTIAYLEPSDTLTVKADKARN
jgi:uncharacterized membrane protein YcaP (DUF421 family)